MQEDCKETKIPRVKNPHDSRGVVEARTPGAKVGEFGPSMCLKDTEYASLGLCDSCPSFPSLIAVKYKTRVRKESGDTDTIG